LIAIITFLGVRAHHRGQDPLAGRTGLHNLTAVTAAPVEHGEAHAAVAGDRERQRLRDPMLRRLSLRSFAWPYGYDAETAALAA
jgi:hypothetical protein